MKLIEPAYTSKSISSKWKALPQDWNQEAILAQFQHAQAVAWFHHALYFGSLQNGRLTFPEMTDSDKSIDWHKHLVRLRIFDSNQEVHIWREAGGLRGRWRLDGQGDSVPYIDSKAPLLGAIVADPADDKAITLKEDRGWNKKVPLPASHQNGSIHLFLQTRHYLEVHPDTHQMGYVDARFVSIQ